MDKFFSKSNRPAQQIGCRGYETAVRKLAFRKRSLISRWPAFDGSASRAPQYSAHDNDYGCCGTLYSLAHPGKPAKVVKKEFDDLWRDRVKQGSPQGPKQKPFRVEAMRLDLLQMVVETVRADEQALLSRFYSMLDYSQVCTARCFSHCICD
jgi:hypothetical protein